MIWIREHASGWGRRQRVAMGKRHRDVVREVQVCLYWHAGSKFVVGLWFQFDFLPTP